MVDISIDNLEWLKDGRPLMGEVEQARMKIFTSVSLSPQLTGSISSTLEISQSRVGDSGVYVCRSTERSQLAGVKLEVKPGQCFHNDLRVDPDKRFFTSFRLTTKVNELLRIKC